MIFGTHLREFVGVYVIDWYSGCCMRCAPCAMKPAPHVEQSIWSKDQTDARSKLGKEECAQGTKMKKFTNNAATKDVRS